MALPAKDTYAILILLVFDIIVSNVNHKVSIPMLSIASSFPIIRSSSPHLMLPVACRQNPMVKQFMSGIVGKLVREYSQMASWISF